jgi:hypothetical protein
MITQMGQLCSSKTYRNQSVKTSSFQSSTTKLRSSLDTKCDKDNSTSTRPSTNAMINSSALLKALHMSTWCPTLIDRRCTQVRSSVLGTTHVTLGATTKQRSTKAPSICSIPISKGSLTSASLRTSTLKCFKLGIVSLCPPFIFTNWRQRLKFKHKKVNLNLLLSLCHYCTRV